MTPRPLLFVAAALVALAGCGEPDPVECGQGYVPAQVDRNADILDQLRSIPMVVALEERTSRYADMRLLVMEVEQPLDHCDPDSPTFNQFASILFREAGAPAVYATNGYAVSRNPTRSEPVVLLGGNQLQVEHRFFGNSRPPVIGTDDWKHLNIFQAATDHHRIARVFANVLRGPWVSTGASKGGMTAIFHRHFYPDDVRATVAYVAPETFGLEDPRYVTFLENVGEPSCRDALKALQRGVLSRRAEMEDALGTYGLANGLSFETFGLEQSLEFAVLESSFAFWQYGDATMCPQIPLPDAAPGAILAFYDEIGVLSFLDDDVLDYYAPYFYQSATELGSPAYPQAHLLELNGGEPIPDRVENYPPFGVPKPFDAERMPQIHDWVATEAQRILFIYGENDPWTAGAYVPNLTGDSHLFTVPGGNHGASIGELPEVERGQATQILSGWMNSAPPPRFEKANNAALYDARQRQRLGWGTGPRGARPPP